MTDALPFTPYDPVTGNRYRMKLSDVDYQKIGRGGPWTATVTDLKTGKVYLARGEACDIETCFCDASAVELTEKEIP